MDTLTLLWHQRKLTIMALTISQSLFFKALTAYEIILNKECQMSVLGSIFATTLEVLYITVVIVLSQIRPLPPNFKCTRFHVQRQIKNTVRYYLQWVLTRKNSP